MLSPAIASHLVAGGVFAGVCVVLCSDPSIRNRHPGLLVATALTALWGLVTAAHAAAWLPIPESLPLTTSWIRNLAWCVAILHILKQAHFARNAWWFASATLQAAIGSVAFVGIVHTLLMFSAVHPLSIEQQWWWFDAGQALICLFGLLLLEQLYKNMTPYQVPQIKLLCLSVGALLGFDYLVTINGLVFQRMDMSAWALRGWVCVLAAPPLALMVWYRQQWVKTIGFTQALAVRPIVLMAGSSYWAMLASVTTYLTWVDGGWREAWPALAIVSLVLGIFWALSARLARAYLRAKMTPTFFQTRFDFRQEWSRFSHVLSARSDDWSLAKRVIIAFANMVDAKGGVLYEKSESGRFERQDTWGNLNQNLAPKEVPNALISWLEETHDVMDAEGFRKQGVAMSHQASFAWICSQPWAWLVVPLIHQEHLHGVVILSHREDSLNLDGEVAHLLQTAGIQAAMCLQQHQAQEALIVARQFEGMNRLAAYLLHDMKNIVSQLSLVLQNAEKQKDNPHFIASVFGTISRSVNQMQQMMQQLNRGQTGLVKEPFEALSVIRRALQVAGSREPIPVLLTEPLPPNVWLYGDRKRFFHILTNLFDNAQTATAASGRIDVRLSLTPTRCGIEILDTGTGMTPEFVENDLFKPFRTTKSAGGMGIGLFEVKDYCQAVGGCVSVDSTLGEGTVVTLVLPTATVSEESLEAARE